MKVNIKRLSSTAIIPTRESKTAAGYDLYADIHLPLTICPHHTVKIPTGVAISLPDGYWGGIFARSGLASKKGLRPANCVGVIDQDYRGELIVAVHNDSDETRIVEPDQRIAQLVVIPCLSIEFEEVNDLDSTDRGTDGFGSTGA